MYRFGIVAVLASWALAGYAETPRQRAHRVRPTLSAAGFHIVPAETAQRQQGTGVAHSAKDSMLLY
jgi:hypothetical protein